MKAGWQCAASQFMNSRSLKGALLNVQLLKVGAR
jgi:hypothetical protein